MAPHSSTLAWKITWMEEPGRLQSMGSQSRTWLSDFTSRGNEKTNDQKLKKKKKMTHWGWSEAGFGAHSSPLAWKIPWAEEPGRLQSMGSERVEHDRVTSLSLFTFMHWRRKWQPTPVFLPGESQGWGSLMGCRLWGRTESDMTEVT